MNKSNISKVINKMKMFLPLSMLWIGAVTSGYLSDIDLQSEATATSSDKQKKAPSFFSLFDIFSICCQPTTDKDDLDDKIKKVLPRVNPLTRVTTPSYSAGNPDILDVLGLMLNEEYLRPEAKKEYEEAKKEYEEAKKEYDKMGYLISPKIKTFVEARDSLERIKADILSDKNNNEIEITPEMREKIINSKLIDTDIRSYLYDYNKILYNYIDASTELKNAGGQIDDASTELKKAGDQIDITIDAPFTLFLLNEIRKYDRFIAAKKELEKYEDMIQLAAASRDVHQALAPKP